MREELMYGCLRTIENDDLRILAGEMIKTIPEYWYHVGASSTGKYHPEYSLGEGGLMRHTVALVRILNYMLEARIFYSLFSTHEFPMEVHPDHGKMSFSFQYNRLSVPALSQFLSHSILLLYHPHSQL